MESRSGLDQPATGRRRAGDVVLVAAWAALAAAAAVLAGLAFRRYFLQEIVFAPRDVVWMLPVGHLVLFGVLAAPLALLAARGPRPVFDAAAPLFLALGAFSVLLSVRAIHPLASLALSVGFAAHLGARWTERWTRMRPWLLRSSLLLALIPVLGGAGWRLARAQQSHHVGSPGPLAADTPNVLLIVLDTFRADHIGAYGYARPTTPVLDRFSASGTLFERAVSASSWSLPSHGTMFTGHWPSDLSARWGYRMTDTALTLAEVLARSGWRTIGISGNHVYGSWESGLARGFQDYRSYVVTPGQVLLTVPLLQMPVVRELWHSRSWGEVLHAFRAARLQVPFEPYRKRRTAPSVTDTFLRWHAGNDGWPFFAFLNYFDAHELDVLPAANRAAFNRGRHQVDRYDGAIAYVDQHLGVLFDTLAARGALDRTLVVVTADHGEQFGEKGLGAHGNSLYMALLHVPLVMRLPGRVPSGIRIPAVVSLRDLSATILDLAGVGGAPLPGLSLANHWRGISLATSPAISEVERAAWEGTTEPVSRGPMRSAVWDGWHYILNGDGAEELFRWPEDYRESSDLAPSPKAAPALAQGRRLLQVVGGGYE